MGGKAEKGTPKYIANKIKAKGLQKLRWYCQMCQKQCRDENGFKCHTTSEAHQRQLILFADNSGQYIDDFSRQFSDGFCELLRRQYGTKRVSANKVYQDYIADREHLHMNATQWETLTDFVKWLGREGLCTVDETEKGWFVAHVDRCPAAVANAQAAARKHKMDKDDQERMMEFIEKQVERGQGGSKGPSYTELRREDEDKLVLNLLKTSSLGQRKLLLAPSSLKALDKRRADDEDAASSKRPRITKKPSALEQIRMEGERKKMVHLQPPKPAPIKPKAADSWLHEGIVVKVLTCSLGPQFHKKKALVTSLVGAHGAEVQMMDSGDRLRLDQDHLETVIPGVGRAVMVLQGKHKGSRGILQGLVEEKASCRVSLQHSKDSLLLPYEHISKIHQSD